MLNIARGAALQVSNAQTIYSFPYAFEEFGSAMIYGVPVVFLVALVLVFIAWFVLNFTVFGRLIYGIGNNEEAVRLAGPFRLALQDCGFHHLRPDGGHRKRLSIWPASTSPARLPASALS